MILWLTGNSGSGKTTMAQQMKTRNSIILDGNEIRDVFKGTIGFSQKARWEHNLRVARLALMLEKQGFDVIVSLICPYKKLRKEVQDICGCGFIYLMGGKIHPDYPYEYEDKFYWKKCKVTVHR